MSESVVARKGSRSASEAPSDALEALRNQTQLDMDGCMVGVSRQALDEVLDYVRHQSAELADAHGANCDANETILALLAALKDIAEHPGPNADDGAHWRFLLARAAIAKAEGVEERPPSAESASTPPPSKAPNT